MATASRYPRLIYAAESLARDTFDNVTFGGNGCEGTVKLQREFRTFANLAMQKFEAVKADLKNWRDQVRCGQVEFSAEREDNLKAALRACVSFLSFLVEKFGEYHTNGLFLTLPRHVGLMDSYRRESEKILKEWQSPEWETANERTVNWDKDQTRHLRKRLGACNPS